MEFKPPSLTLAQAGQATSSIYLDTDDVIGYLSSNRKSATSPLIFAAILPLLALFAPRRRRWPAILCALLTVAILTSATGCSGKYPASTAPGTYTLQLTATGTTTGTTHTLSIPFTVTQ
jgi:hypothetical protein